MSATPSEYEQGLLAQRRAKLAEIGAIGQRLGLSPADSLYPSRFPSRDETITFAQIPDYDTPGAPVSAEELEREQPQVAVAGR